MFSETYGHPLVRTPNMNRLARSGTTFQNAYCNSPLCMPSRMSFMAGRYIHRIGTWDNATPLPTDCVTWAHLLRSVGYDVVLSGKQHFCGPDRLHGFRAQLARDLHGERRHPIHGWKTGIPIPKGSWKGVEEAGPGITEEIEVDDLAEENAIAYLRESERNARPWALNVGFIAPHFPLVVPQRFWNQYPLEAIDLPEMPEGHLESLHPVYRRMRKCFGMIEFPEEALRRARAGYYGLITFLDEKIGRLVAVLEETGQLANTVIIHTSDHGEMNGEHGMFRKSNFFEQSARIPLQLSWPGHIPSNRRMEEVVSLVDVVATILDVADVEPLSPVDGDSLLPLIEGCTKHWKNEAFSEYTAHGVSGPMAMLRRGRYKLIYSLGDPVQLFDLHEDPGEFRDLGESSDSRDVVNDMTAQLLRRWDPGEVDRRVRLSQRERLLMEECTSGRWRD